MGISWNCKDIIIIIRTIILNIKPIPPFVYNSPELFQVFLIKVSKNVSPQFEWAIQRYWNCLQHLKKLQKP